MKSRQILGIVLVLAGVLALVYGGFTYTEDRHDVEIGPLELQVKDKERISIPVWAGVIAVIGGLALAVLSPRRS